MTLRRKIGIGLLAGAFLPYAAATLHVYRYTWTPLDYPVHLHRGEIRTPEFTPRVAGTYALFLQIQLHRIELQRQDCLLDMSLLNPSRCAAIPSIIALSWKLWSGSNVIADNTTQQTWPGREYGRNYVRREIGRFDCEQGHRYRLSIDFQRDPGELNAANPKLVAQPIQDWDAFAIETQGTFALGIVLAVVGLVLTLWPEKVSYRLDI